MPGPLNGINVVEFAGIGPAPFCAMQLADMGAHVVRVERPRPQSEEPESNARIATKLTSRGAKSVALDLKMPEAVDAVLRMISRADVVIEGFRPGVMERLGLGPDTCLRVNPNLVYGRMTGWGQSGPLSHAAGHDINYVSLSGALHCIGTADSGPLPPLNLLGDYGGGGMMLAYAIACALLNVKAGGTGQVIDMAMVDGATSLMGPIYALHEAGRWRDGRGENTLDGGAPFWRTYQCQDDQWVAISPNDRQFLALLLSRLGLTEKEFGDLHDSSAWPRQRKLLEERFAQKTRAQWCEELEGTDACFSPVLSLTEAPSHPHLKDRGTFIEVEGRLQPAPPFKFSTTPCDHPAPPPTPGQHTVSELQACGLTADEISRLVLPM